MIWLLVAVAGGIGAVARFIVDSGVGRLAPRIGVPLGTTAINITGSLLLGWVSGRLAAHTGDPSFTLMLGTGFLGGYTTFSTASVEAARLNRAGQRWLMAVHAGAMLVLSVASAAFGFWLGGS